MTILVIDGQGGKLGKTLVENIKKSFPHLEIMAVGTNSAASDVMRRAGADRVATGENPVIVACRSGIPHNYDIVEGPMADDTIFNYVQSYTDGEISRAAFWELARFKHPTHQISFHTARALAALTFERSYEVHA